MACGGAANTQRGSGRQGTREELHDLIPRIRWISFVAQSSPRIHVAVLRQGRMGERYILGGQNVSLAQTLGDIARLVGRSPPMSVLNGARNMITCEAMRAAAAAHGRPPLGPTLGGTIDDRSAVDQRFQDFVHGQRRC
jgi:hypothetical protein